MQYASFDAAVIGSGAAGFAAAMYLAKNGVDVCLLTEDVTAGTSRNTGSDKQTYYKLSLCGNAPDSVRAMARDLFGSGCTDGDTAFVEAALSARCFYTLAALGVPFPQNAYGEFPGYRTDHDTAARASSAGPLTSRYMTEALEAEVRALGVPIFDRTYAVKLLADEEGVCGVFALDTGTGAPAAFCAPNVVLATGGPAGIYLNSVYPVSQHGSASLALEAGASLQNVTEWQYGLASVDPRWNVSGAYMQVLPRVYSLDENGTEREFLSEWFPNEETALEALFLKGYEWPFSAEKAKNGSSKIDIAVYTETVLKHRRVFLDYTQNPFGRAKLTRADLPQTAARYLAEAGVWGDTPYARLCVLNAPAAKLFADKGTDLDSVPLEIALCAQHMNGGVSVDSRWQTEVPGLYAAGECAGTHGVRRPGGSALNAGQAGAYRAAESVAKSKKAPPSPVRFAKALEQALTEHEAFKTAVLSDKTNVAALGTALRRTFDAVCAAVRRPDGCRRALEETDALYRDFRRRVRIQSAAELPDAYRLRDLLVTQRAMLECVLAFCNAHGTSRGSAIVPTADDLLSFSLSDGTDEKQIQTVRLTNGGFTVAERPVRPLPEPETNFETVWRETWNGSGAEH